MRVGLARYLLLGINVRRKNSLLCLVPFVTCEGRHFLGLPYAIDIAWKVVTTWVRFRITELNVNILLSQTLRDYLFILRPYVIWVFILCFEVVRLMSSPWRGYLRYVKIRLAMIYIQRLLNFVRKLIILAKHL